MFGSGWPVTGGSWMAQFVWLDVVIVEFIDVNTEGTVSLLDNILIFELICFYKDLLVCLGKITGRSWA